MVNLRGSLANNSCKLRAVYQLHHRMVVRKEVMEVDNGANVSYAPWTNDEVASLNAYQESGFFHPFTGRNDLLPRGKDDILVATNDGWISKVDPELSQTWAHAWMADWSWKDTSTSLERMFSFHKQ